MIVSVSRRTDIPAFYSEWFIKRLEDGYAFLRNPYNRNQISKVNLSPEIVDCFVFWTKDPEPLMNKLSALEEYNYYFQITMTPYESDIEPYVRDKKEILKTMTTLSKLIGKNRVIWRYDPILLNDKYTKQLHYEQFEKWAVCLSGYVNNCIISFIDQYNEVKRNLNKLKLHNIENSDMLEISERFMSIGRRYGIEIKSCAETLDLSSVGVSAASCIDSHLISSITGKVLIQTKKDTIRTGCLCAKSVDIGDYNSCLHGCIYCYANYNHALINTNSQNNIISSPLLIGSLCGNEKITVHNLCRKTFLHYNS